MGDVLFVGVSTGSSLIHHTLPCWRPLLAADFGLRGVDVQLDADDGSYRELLRAIQRDGSVHGAVVTSHKVRLFHAAGDLLDRVDDVARSCDEVNAVRRRPDGSLDGWARDPISVGRTVDRIWPNEVGEVVCLGAGGTAIALAYHLRANRPRVRLTCADPSPEAGAGVRRVASNDVAVRIGAGPWDDVIAAAPTGSLIVDATGLGKDQPGSPTTEAVRFPTGSVVWELNYRGDLAFLRQARRQSSDRNLAVHDGWELFCHGWASALTAVLDLPDDPGLGTRFAEAARHLRPTVS